MNVAVVGAGIMGLSTAVALGERGHTVVIYDPVGPGNPWGSSHGRSRIVRKAYPDPYYIELMLEAYPLWQSLDERLGGGVLDECGLAYFGNETSPSLQAMIAGLEGLDVEFAVEEPHEARLRADGLRLKPGEVSVFSRDGGWVRADRVIAGLAGLAADAGARFVPERVDDLADLRDFDAAVLCIGADIGKFVRFDHMVHLQSFAYVRGERAGPVWIDDTLEIYGFPSEPTSGMFKVGYHRATREVDPAERPGEARPAPEEQVRAILSFVAERFDLSSTEVVESVGCLYTRTPNDDFRIGRLDERTMFASPCSGHGFKFGPWIGRLMADVVEGEADPATYPRFLAGSV